MPHASNVCLLCLYASFIFCVYANSRVGAKGHVAKGLRRKSIGLMVLRVAISTLGRVWTVGTSELVVVEVGLLIFCFAVSFFVFLR